MRTISNWKISSCYINFQENFAPVEEIGEIVEAVCFEGEIPADFPQGVYMRNGMPVFFFREFLNTPVKFCKFTLL